MLIDITKCVGCGMCSVACQAQNGLTSTQNEELDAETWTVVKAVEVEADGEQQKRFIKNQCFHCLDPACASACLVGALEKTPTGAVVYDGDKCMGCRYCMIACPFNIPKYQWDSPFPLVRKCVFCVERLEAGEAPACASACPTKATLFGTREELVAEAVARIQSEPEKYVPHIYGLEEVGGTSVLYLSDVPFAELGFPTDLGTRPLSEYTWAALSKLPAVVIGGALVLGAAYKLSKDRGEEDEA
ncbi:MAG: 4Fe-4S dicluster domain-containing protein [Clostridia bacterium]|nr:4Fe-4S dicluster domain-containing protein [Clostridia bacterium]